MNNSSKNQEIMQQFSEALLLRNSGTKHKYSNTIFFLQKLSGEVCPRKSCPGRYVLIKVVRDGVYGFELSGKAYPGKNLSGKACPGKSSLGRCVREDVSTTSIWLLYSKQCSLHSTALSL